jgi:hypothetical protein
MKFVTFVPYLQMTNDNIKDTAINGFDGKIKNTL